MACGEQHAMRILFARHQIPVYRFVLRIVRDQAQAEDVLSETFFEAWKQAAHFEGRSSVSTWLLAIARHRALSLLRRRSEAQLDDVTAEQIVDPADTPEVALQKKNSGELLRHCIEQLPAEQSQMLDLVYYHEKSVAEIAEITGVPEGTVKTRVHYARKKLAQMLARGYRELALRSRHAESAVANSKGKQRAYRGPAVAIGIPRSNSSARTAQSKR
jgi:RNA polymerase sigma-70 factor (ECF subfamily)